MLTVTDAALEHLAVAKGQIEEPKPADACFRIVPTNGGKLSLTIGAPETEDTKFQHEGVTLLVISPEVSKMRGAHA